MKWSITVGASFVLAILLAQLATHTISAKAATADQSSGRQTRAEDFDRAVAMSSKFERLELSMMAQLKLAQGVLDGPPQKPLFAE